MAKKLIILALAAVVLLVGLWFRQPTTATWPTYTNTEFGFSIQYPPEWSVLGQPNGVYFKNSPEDFKVGVLLIENQELEGLDGEHMTFDNVNVVKFSNYSSYAQREISEYILSKPGSRFYKIIENEATQKRTIEKMVKTFRIL